MATPKRTGPRGDIPALYGYYAPQVQRVARRWAARIHPDRLPAVFVQAATFVLDDCRSFSFALATRAEQSLVAELLPVLIRLRDDASKPFHWIVVRKHFIMVGDGDGLPSWPRVAWNIHRSGGPWFPESTLKRAYTDLRLGTSVRKTARKTNA